MAFPSEQWRVASVETVLWRVHRTCGGQVAPWNELRHRGTRCDDAIRSTRPPRRAQDRGVSYAALSVLTALAEVFQQTCVINIRRGSPYRTAWSPARDLTLLDLTGSWPIRAGASYAINAGRRDHCRAWAQAIHTARPDLDGLWHHSSMTGGDAVTLFTRAVDSFPNRPRLSLPLDHPRLRGHLFAVATQIGHRVV